MKIDEHVYFAPGILLKDININERESLIHAFELRMNKYYLQPIKILNKLRSAFSVGIIEFSMIDSLARYSTNDSQVGRRIKDMIRVNFNTTEEIAEKAYDEFRCGLLHENHIKNCGQFCYETTSSFTIDSGCLIINPLKLQRELVAFFEDYTNNLRNDDDQYNTFLTNIKIDFGAEVEFFRSC
jgi:hypothetical protein